MAESTKFMYQRVRSDLENMIRTNVYGVGCKLPSERELAKSLGCNFQTIRRGLALLVDEGVIERRMGSGTYVRRVPEYLAGTSAPFVKAIDVKSVGVIGSLMTGDYPGEFLRHLQAVAERRKYRLTIRTVKGLGDEAREVAAELMDQGCGGLMLPMFDSDASAGDVWEFVRASRVPVVMCRSYPGLEKYCYERSDVFGRPSMEAVELSCGYLKDLLYKHIAFFGGNGRMDSDLQRRIMAYSYFMHQHEMSPHIALVGPEAAEVDAVVERWSSMAGELAVVCWGDEYAIRLMTALHKRGLRIPEDVAVVGFGDHAIAKNADPPLTTIKFDFEYVANAVLDHLEAQHRGEWVQADGTGVRQTMVIRDSCGLHVRPLDVLKACLERKEKGG